MYGEIKVINIKTTNTPTDGVYFYIGRNKNGNILGNPFTHMSNGTLAKYVVGSREEAISKYKEYFIENYNNNKNFKDKIDEIYSCYFNGKKVYLGCFCSPLSCHGDIIKQYLEIRYMKEMLNKK